MDQQTFRESLLYAKEKTGKNRNKHAGAEENSNITTEMTRYYILETIQGWSNKEQLENQ